MYKKTSILALKIIALLFVVSPVTHVIAQDEIADRGRETNYDLYDRNRDRLDFNPYDYGSTREDVYDRDYFYQGSNNFSSPVMNPSSNQYYNQDDYNYYQR